MTLRLKNLEFINKEKYKRGGGFMNNIICECCGEKIKATDNIYWLNNDLLDGEPELKFCSAKCLCEHYGYIFDWHGEQQYIDEDIDSSGE